MKRLTRLIERKDFLSISLLLMLTITLFLNIVDIHAALQDTKVRVINPRTGKSDFKFYTGTDPVGTLFNATAWVYNVEDLFAYQVYLTYNSTLLNVTRAWLPKWDPQWVFGGRPPGQTVSPLPFLYMGAVKVGDSLQGVVPRFNGAGLLVVIEFKIIYAPPSGKVFCNLDIDNADTYLLNYDLNEIPTGKEGGYYEYKYAVMHLEVKPKRYLASKLETFNVEVWLNNASESDRIIGAQFRLQYNATLLKVQKVTEGLLFEQFRSRAEEPFTQFVQYNITRVEDDPLVYPLLGPHILVGIVILSNDTGQYSSFPKGSGILATVTFRGRYRSFYKALNSPLELTDISVVDDTRPEPREIATASPKNGLYEISRITVWPVLKVQPNVYEAKKKDETFNVDISIDNLHVDAQLNSVELKLTYNSTLLEVLNITEGPFLRGCGNTTFNYLVVSGSVTIQNHLDTVFASFPNGNGTIAKVTFKAVHRGFYPPKEINGTLNLKDIVLLDVGQNRIPTLAAMNGFYKILSLRPPVGMFTYSPSKPMVTQEVVFNASGSYDYSPGAVVRYVWNFGDGNPTTVTSPIIKHVYTTPGTYNVTLTVIDDDGLSGSDVKTVVVEAQPEGIPLWIVVIVVLAAIVVIAAVVVYYKKIRKYESRTV